MRPSLPAAALAALACVAAAEPAADPAAPAPPIRYQSVLDPAPRGVEEGNVPWRAANAAVAEFPRGHIDLLKWEARQGEARPASAPPAPAAPAATPSAPAAGPAHAPHGGHHR